ncbi:DUF3060 domain-containing protein [Mycobacterium marseillense]|jgi:hypothetical protein|uniref:DUF3060 domain-containing protein n=2 Tax=Mycobacterium marseillense TaxID=701042 RepID=A0ABM7JEE2_9MYCO|nr:DUF3060 domain-containing protein [Mycobacterium marseillense]MDM3976202.1 DUF3060 domain-containing protein [Mycobacterium marseillense]BBY12339.1 hypothetical protein MMARJ_30790 [Mycobacterium marseillense]
MTQTMQHPDQAADLAKAPRQHTGLWLAALAAGLAVAGLVSVGLHTDLAHGSQPSEVPDAGTLQVSGAGTTKTLPCHAGYLSVSGKNNTITLTGHCTSVTVSGNNNRVAVDSTDALSASGTGNVVVYHWGSPKVVNAGTANVVRQG